jgi:transposase InsO family protein
VAPSMGSVGDAYDNAMCESFFATLECELLDRRRFASQAEARMACFSFIEGWYNPARLHSALGYGVAHGLRGSKGEHLSRTVTTASLTTPRKRGSFIPRYRTPLRVPV